MIDDKTDRFLAGAVQIATEDAQDRGDLGFTARSLVLCTLPHRDPKTPHFVRTNGNYTLTLAALNAKIGLPFGVVPRLLIAWISTEIVRTRSKTIVLGSSLSDFLRELGLSRQGGPRGDITRLRDQMRRLFSCYVSADYHDQNRDATDGFKIVKKSDVWWHPQSPDQAGLWESTLTVSDEFYNEVLAAPIPIDIKALKLLRRSPMQLDLYMWLTFRNSYLKEPTTVTWKQLQMQFGAEYGRSRDFKVAFLEALEKVHVVYPSANINPTAAGVLIAPSPVHVRKIRKGKNLSNG